MELETPPSITSFVIRFVQAESILPADERRLTYRGTIRHIQSDEELSFTHWADAIAFIRRFVRLEMEEG